jgi:acyl-CoA thioester hydrolase
MKHQFKQRIIYKDTDAEGVVYYANYLGFFERGRAEFLRDLGLSISKLRNQDKIAFAITKVDCDYYLPALLDDEITITTEVKEMKKASIIFKQEAKKDGKILVSARITACALRLKDFKPARLPAKLKEVNNPRADQPHYG